MAVLINGLGATPKEEMYVLYRKVGLILKEKKISVYHVYVGEFATSLEMAGASISLLKLDDELTKLLGKARPHSLLRAGPAVMEAVGIPEIRSILGTVARIMTEKKDELIRLDGAVGDGDLGLDNGKSVRRGPR